jgi:FtsZ-interacting cell division protein ZipA
MASKEILCPNCGSKNVEKDGVPVNRKKGLGYYLSGQAAFSMGEKHGAKLVNSMKGEKKDCFCRDCQYRWNSKEEQWSPNSTAAVKAVPQQPTVQPQAQYTQPQYAQPQQPVQAQPQYTQPRQYAQPQQPVQAQPQYTQPRQYAQPQQPVQAQPQYTQPQYSQPQQSVQAQPQYTQPRQYSQPQQPEPAQPAPKASSNTISAAVAVEAILKYKELLDMGILTPEEFEAKKKELLGLSQ